MVWHSTMKMKNIINALTVKQVFIFPQIYTKILPWQFCASDTNLEHGNLDSYLCSSGTLG